MHRRSTCWLTSKPATWFFLVFFGLAAVTEKQWGWRLVDVVLVIWNTAALALAD